MHYMMDHRLYDFLLVCYCKYSSIFSDFRPVWRWRISRPWL